MAANRDFTLTGKLNIVLGNSVKPLIAQIQSQLQNVNAVVDVKLNSSLQGRVSKVNQEFQNLNKTLNQTALSATNIAQQMSLISGAFSGLRRGMNQTNIAAKQTTATLVTQNKVLKESSGFFNQIGLSAAQASRRVAIFIATAGAIYGFVNAIKDAVKQGIEFERELNKISQVTGRPVSSLNDLSEAITNVSTSFGVSSKDITQASLILAQAGFTATEVKKSLEALAKTQLAPNFKDLGNTVEGVIAITRQFNIESDKLSEKLGSVNAVAGAFAVEAEDIISAVRKAGGVFATAGGSFEEFIALFTAVRQTTRESADSIATGLRTIFARIQRPETIADLKRLNIELLDANKNFIGPYESVRRLNEALSQTSPRSQAFAQIVEQLGGLRQLSRTIPLIQQFAVAERARAVAMAGTKSLDEASAQAQETLINKLTKLRENFIALFRTITNDNSIKAFIGGVIDLASALVTLTRALTPLLPLLSAVVAVKGVSALSPVISGFATAVTGGRIIRRASGGYIPGSGNSDSVPAMLTPGEFVIRKSAAQALGPSRLNKINNFASGGPVQKFAIGGFVKKIVQRRQVSLEDFANEQVVKQGFLNAQPLSAPALVAKDNIINQQKEALALQLAKRIVAEKKTSNLEEGLILAKAGLQSEIQRLGGVYKTAGNSVSLFNNRVTSSLVELTSMVRLSGGISRILSKGANIAVPLGLAALNNIRNSDDPLQRDTVLAAGTGFAIGGTIGTSLGLGPIGASLAGFAIALKSGTEAIDSFTKAAKDASISEANDRIQLAVERFSKKPEKLNELVNEILVNANNISTFITPNPEQPSNGFLDRGRNFIANNTGLLRSSEEVFQDELKSVKQQNAINIRTLREGGTQALIGTINEVKPESVEDLFTKSPKIKQILDRLESRGAGVASGDVEGLVNSAKSARDAEAAVKAFQETQNQLNAVILANTTIAEKFAAVLQNVAIDAENASNQLDSVFAGRQGNFVGSRQQFSAGLSNINSPNFISNINSLQQTGILGQQGQAIGDLLKEFSSARETLTQAAIEQERATGFTGSPNDGQANIIFQKAINSLPTFVREIANKQFAVGATQSEVIKTTEGSDVETVRLSAQEIARQTLPDSVIEPFKEVFERAAKIFEDAVSKLDDRLKDFNEANVRVADERSKLTSIQTDNLISRRSRTLNGEADPQLGRILLESFAKQQGNLTTANAFNPEEIGRQIAEAQDRLSGLTFDASSTPQQVKAVEIERAKNVLEIQKNNQALRNLVDGLDSVKNALDASRKTIEEDRNSRLSFAERLLTSNPEERLGLIQSARLANIAREQGNFNGFQPEQIRAALEVIQAAGPTFAGLREQLILGSSIGGRDVGKLLGITSRDADPRLQAINQEQDRIGNIQERAQQQIIGIVETESRFLFDNLNSGFDKIFENLNQNINSLGQTIINPKEVFVNGQNVVVNQKDSKPQQDTGEPPLYKAGGGGIFKPKGTDTVPAMLTPGEFIVNRDAAGKNRKILEMMNSGKDWKWPTGYYADGGSITGVEEYDRLRKIRQSTGFDKKLKDFLVDKAAERLNIQKDDAQKLFKKFDVLDPTEFNKTFGELYPTKNPSTVKGFYDRSTANIGLKIEPLLISEAIESGDLSKLPEKVVNQLLRTSTHEIVHGFDKYGADRSPKVSTTYASQTPGSILSKLKELEPLVTDESKNLTYLNKPEERLARLLSGGVDKLPPDAQEAFNRFIKISKFTPRDEAIAAAQATANLVKAPPIKDRAIDVTPASQIADRKNKTQAEINEILRKEALEKQFNKEAYDPRFETKQKVRTKRDIDKVLNELEREVQGPPRPPVAAPVVAQPSPVIAPPKTPSVPLAPSTPEQLPALTGRSRSFVRPGNVPTPSVIPLSGPTVPPPVTLRDVAQSPKNSTARRLGQISLPPTPEPLNFSDIVNGPKIPGVSPSLSLPSIADTSPVRVNQEPKVKVPLAQSSPPVRTTGTRFTIPGEPRAITGPTIDTGINTPRIAGPRQNLLPGPLQRNRPSVVRPGSTPPSVINLGGRSGGTITAGGPTQQFYPNLERPAISGPSLQKPPLLLTGPGREGRGTLVPPGTKPPKVIALPGGNPPIDSPLKGGINPNAIGDPTYIPPGAKAPPSIRLPSTPSTREPFPIGEVLDANKPPGSPFGKPAGLKPITVGEKILKAGGKALEAGGVALRGFGLGAGASEAIDLGSEAVQKARSGDTTGAGVAGLGSLGSAFLTGAEFLGKASVGAAGGIALGAGGLLKAGIDTNIARLQRRQDELAQPGASAVAGRLPIPIGQEEAVNRTLIEQRDVDIEEGRVKSLPSDVFRKQRQIKEIQERNNKAKQAQASKDFLARKKAEDDAAFKAKLSGTDDFLAQNRKSREALTADPSSVLKTPTIIPPPVAPATSLSLEPGPQLPPEDVLSDVSIRTPIAPPVTKPVSTDIKSVTTPVPSSPKAIKRFTNVGGNKEELQKAAQSRFKDSRFEKQTEAQNRFSSVGNDRLEKQKAAQSRFANGVGEDSLFPSNRKKIGADAALDKLRQSRLERRNVVAQPKELNEVQQERLDERISQRQDKFNEFARKVGSREGLSSEKRDKILQKKADTLGRNLPPGSIDVDNIVAKGFFRGGKPNPNEDPGFARGITPTQEFDRQKEIQDIFSRKPRSGTDRINQQNRANQLTPSGGGDSAPGVNISELSKITADFGAAINRAAEVLSNASKIQLSGEFNHNINLNVNGLNLAGLNENMQKIANAVVSQAVSQIENELKKSGINLTLNTNNQNNGA